VHSNLLTPGKRRDEVMSPASLMQDTNNQPVIPSLDEDDSEAVDTEPQSSTKKSSRAL